MRASPLLIYTLLLLVGLALARDALSAPLIWDDLHLLRHYSAEELAATWHDTWDPDRVETPGLRPLTTAFNQLRYALLGEALAAHRILLLALLCADLTLLYLLARELFGAPPALGLAAGLLVLTHPSAVGTYLWLADGVHPWELLWLIAALLALARWLLVGGRAMAVASLLCAAVAMLIRPEAALLLPLAALVVAATPAPPRGRHHHVALNVSRRRGAPPAGPENAGRPHAARRRLAAWGGPGALPRLFERFHCRIASAGGYLLGLALLLLGFWSWQLATVQLEPAWAFPGELAWALREVAVGPSAPMPPPWTTVPVAVLVRAVCGSVGPVALAIAARPPGRRRALFWALAGAVGALHTLVGARSNLLLLPIAFWALALATLAVDASRSAPGRALALVVVAPLLAAQVALGAVLQREHRWNNLEWVCTHAVALYGNPPLSGIPPTRRESLAAMLSSFGIRSERDARAALPALVADALREGRLGPTSDDDRPFVPRLSLLVGPGRWITPCGEDVASLSER